MQELPLGAWGCSPQSPPPLIQHGCLLIRPILTYACPLWYNQSASAMEKIRAFERACLRTCTKKYRSAKSDYKNYVSNKQIYNEANIPRINNFMIKLNREYFANIKKIKNNNQIAQISNIDHNYMEACKRSGYLPPEAFTLLDHQGLIQNHANTPLIYHWSRNNCNKKIPINPNSIPPLKYSTALPNRDLDNSNRLDTKKF